ncbi:MAG: hypothetical protein KFB96_00570 [Thiocapsa sp.]|uniref:hypothetical protein n=1 Tax=Thiocapsa sp. TaxID=2024551 RepID=UPI001BCBAC78|nr:hypothetical protein [Thiocapsa sp.]QVL49070.1 MAG: hypothetical protein KFB96_00570 [Thiocapsa sp.]
MNLNNSPTIEQLAALVAECDDGAGHHVLWVDRDGDVHISTVPKHLSPVGFEQATPEMKLRNETFAQGNDYVGPNAAKDERLISDLLKSLKRAWAEHKNHPGVDYIDY